ncbi:MAG: C-terminal domain [Mycobacterium sp.]|nr:C-terminal domain [Mycobacterium sp.]
MVTDGQGFNITVKSNGGQMHFGLIGCRELVPDIDVIARYLVEELDKLLKLAHDVERDGNGDREEPRTTT